MLKDPRNVASVFEYDKLNREKRNGEVVGNGVSFVGGVIQQTYAETINWENSEYDVSGNRILFKNRDGKTVDFDYDLLDRVITETWAHPLTTNNPVNVVVSIYDLAGQLLSVSDKYAKVKFQYDYAGRIISEINGDTPGQLNSIGIPTVNLTSQFRADGQRESLRDGLGLQETGVAQPGISFQYDPVGRFSGISQMYQTGTGLENDPIVTFKHDVADRVVQQKRRNSNVETSTFDYDPTTGRLASIHHQKQVSPTNSQSQTVLYIAYNFDRFDRLVDENYSVTSPNAGINTNKFEYDNRNQVTTVARTSSTPDQRYYYDASGNRSNSKTHLQPWLSHELGSAFNQNRVKSTFRNGAEIESFHYDKEGNLLWRRFDDNSYLFYEWDNRNRLVKIYDRTPQQGFTKVVTMVYDPFDRLISITSDLDGNTNTPPEKIEKFVYDGEDIYLNYDKNNSLTNRYIHGTETDQVLVDEVFANNSNGDLLWLLGDHQNSVRAIVDATTRTVLKRIDEYGAFGTIDRVETAPGVVVDELFGYTGRPYFEDIELQNNRARWYDANLGRFISSDPSGFGGGDYNLYRYVANNPLTYTDPSGLIGSQLLSVVQNVAAVFAPALTSAVSTGYDTLKRGGSIGDAIGAGVGSYFGSSPVTQSMAASERRLQAFSDWHDNFKSEVTPRLSNPGASFLSSNSYAAPSFFNTEITIPTFGASGSSPAPANYNTVHSFNNQFLSDIPSSGFLGQSSASDELANHIYRSTTKFRHPNATTAESLGYWLDDHTGDLVYTAIGLNPLVGFAQDVVQVVRQPTNVLSYVGFINPVPFPVSRVVGRSADAVTSVARTAPSKTAMNSGGDRLLNAMGPARVNHADELASIVDDLRAHNVEIRWEPNRLSYGPSGTPGRVGNINLDPNASISAIRHEYGHFLDDVAEGLPGMGHYMKDPWRWVATERRQYLQEIRTARKLGDAEARRQLIQDYVRERSYILDRYLPQR